MKPHAQIGTPPVSRNVRTPKQVREQQQADAEKIRQKSAVSPDTPATPPAVVKSSVPATADDRPYRERYLDEVAPATFPGKLVKFTKDGAFIINETEEEISSEKDFVALCDETLIGWIKFSGEEGVPPTRVQGLLYDGFVMPPRDSLDDFDRAQWEIGLDGEPADPWLHQQCLVLEDRATHDLYTFATTTKTGRRGVGNLLRHYDRLQKSHPDLYPVVRLKAGGFPHKDTRVGWVHTPTFRVVGRAPKADAAKPDSSPAGDMNDQIPF